jgi:hypothetical protein
MGERVLLIHKEGRLMEKDTITISRAVAEEWMIMPSTKTALMFAEIAHALLGLDKQEECK